VLIIQRALPLKDRLDLVRDVTVETVLLTVRRAPGGMMSFRAEIRS
jgi:hypothetical protein